MSFYRATQRDSNQGLGTASNTTPEAGDNEYEAYRKRMMLAYRFRPNPLVNLYDIHFNVICVNRIVNSNHNTYLPYLSISE